ncbi:hypothetical protein A9Q78_01370 [Methylophaga sp. 41_12_T18]|nr:hypothetical protein A9Q78_01370 [Methylophaga sp. 41_12_T18]
MLTRYRWYLIKIPIGCASLISAIGEHLFSQNENDGFSIIEETAEECLCRFIYRTNVQVTSLNGDGTTVIESISSVNITNFSIVTRTKPELTFLRIENPGKSSRELLNALESLVGFGFMVKPLNFEKSSPSTIFNSLDSTKLIGLKVVSAVIDKDLVARMEFASKNGIDISSIKPLQGVNYKLLSATYQVFFEGIKGQLTYSSGGLIKVSGQLAPKILHLIETDLPNFI